MGGMVRLVRFLLRSARGLRFSSTAISLVILTSIVSGLAGAGFIAVINSVLNRAEGREEWLLWAFGALCVVLPISRFLSNVLLLRLSNRAILELRMKLCRQILAAPLRKLEELGTARLMASLTQDVGSIVNALANTPRILMNVAIVLGTLAYLAWLSLPVFGIVLLAVVLGIASYQLPILKARGYFRQQREESDRLFGHYRGLTEGTKELKMHRRRRDSFMRDHLEATSENILRASVRGGTIFDAANSWGQVLFYILIGFILFALPAYYQLDRETLTGYVLAILYMITPLDVILALFPNLARASIAINKVQGLGIQLAESGRDIAVDRPLPSGQWRHLQLDGVTHSYYREQEDETFTLGPVDLEFEPGELVFLVGGNGSGKTTLAKLLIGLYTPEKGEVHLDGEKVDGEKIDDYRQLFAVVFTDFFLFDRLIGLERPDLDDHAKLYLEKLHLERKLSIREGALSTVDLSQGQRKRLALLTAYLEDRPIYLFDEWAADQDPQFKEIFYRALLPELKQRGKTVFVISHDDHYYDVADRIIKLDYGKVELDAPVDDYRAALARVS